MAKFCGKCGSKLDEATGLCPNCSIELLEKKVAKKAKKNAKRVEMTTGQKMKMRSFFLKLIICLILLIILIIGIIGGLSYLGIVETPFFSIDTTNYNLETVNENRIIVEEMDIEMQSDTQGTAAIIIEMPDYEKLFLEASLAENPEQYLLEALVSGNYEVLEFEKKAKVTANNGEIIIHFDEVVHQLLEEALINAINTVSEEK